MSSPVPAQPEPSRRATALALGAVVALALWHLAPLLTPPFATDAIVGSDSYRSHDWLEVAKLDHYARVALLDQGRLPLWNPLMAGGQPQFAHPSDGTASPLILSSLLFGETLGMKLNVVLVALLGALGVFLLLRQVLGTALPAAVTGAGLAAWAGWLPSRVGVGFYESCLMAAWPMVLALWLMPGGRRARRRRWVGAALLLWALAIQLQLAVPVLVLLMGVIFTATAVQDRRAGAPFDRETLLGGLAILGLAGLLGAIKFVPMLDLLAQGDFRSNTVYPTHPDAWYRNFEQLWFGLFHRVPEIPIADVDGNPRVQEYMTLLPGLGALVLAAVALPSLRRAHRAVPWLAAGLVFGWLSFGPHGLVDGFRPLFGLPLFSSMRGPLRYFNYPLLLALLVLAGVGLDAVHQRWGERAAWAGAGLALLLSLPGALDARTLYETAFLYAAPPLEAVTTLRSEGLGHRSVGRAHALNLRKYGNIRRGVPTVYVPEDLPIEVGAVPATWLQPDGSVEDEPAYRGEAWVSTDALLAEGEAGPGIARLLSMKAQEVVVEHTLPAPGVVLVNQNSWLGWACEGRTVSAAAAEHARLLGFEAPAGQGTTTCTWTPPGFAAGAALSGLGWIGLLALWPWRRAGRR